MSELKKMQGAMARDESLRQKYLDILDTLMTDGQVTPEMASVAAQKLGFKVSADDFESEHSDAELSLDELAAVGGGMTLGGDTAPDGQQVGCPYNFYLTWTDYWVRNNEGHCPKGGIHEPESVGATRICRKCRLDLNERGVLNMYDESGNKI